VEAYTKAWENLQESYKRQKTNLHTEKINEADQQRDEAFKSLWYKSKGFFYEANTENRTAAKNILSILSL
jgi:hypothetical protein